MESKSNKSLILAAARDFAADDDATAEGIRSMVALTARLIGLSSMYADDPELVTALILGT